MYMMLSFLVYSLHTICLFHCVFGYHCVSCTSWSSHFDVPPSLLLPSPSSLPYLSLSDVTYQLSSTIITVKCIRLFNDYLPHMIQSLTISQGTCSDFTLLWLQILKIFVRYASIFFLCTSCSHSTILRFLYTLLNFSFLFISFSLFPFPSDWWNYYSTCNNTASLPLKS